jgi:hypothetical protein
MSDDQPDPTGPPNDPIGTGPAETPPPPPPTPPTPPTGWAPPGFDPDVDPDPTDSIPVSGPPGPPAGGEWRDQTMSYPVGPPVAPAPSGGDHAGGGPPYAPTPGQYAAGAPMGTHPGTPPPPPGYGPPVAGWASTPPGVESPAAVPANRNRTGLVVGLVVIALLVVGGVIAAVVALGGTATSGISLGIDTCEIAADGSMSANGTISNDGSDSATFDIEVDFSDTATGETVVTDTMTVTVAAGSSERWSGTGTAGEEVRRITCDVTAER